MLVGTDMSHDARVQKEASTLARRGYDVTILAAHNPSLPDEEVRDGVRIVRVVPKPLRRSSKTGGEGSTGLTATTPQKQMKPMAAPQPSWPRRWLWNARLALAHVRWVRQLDPDVVHIHDSDRLFVGGLASLGTNRPFV
jgi:hypothetical protein